MAIRVVITALDRAAQAVAGLACIGIVIMMVCGIAARAFALPLYFADEYGGYLMAAVVFLTLPAVTRRREHISADYPANRTGPRTQLVLRALADALLLAYTAVLLWLACRMTVVSYADGLRSQGLMNSPMYLPQAVMALGLALMAARAALEFFESSRAAFAGRRSNH